MIQDGGVVIGIHVVWLVNFFPTIMMTIKIMLIMMMMMMMMMIMMIMMMMIMMMQKCNVF